MPPPPYTRAPSEVSNECPPFAGSRKAPPCVETSRPSPPPKSVTNVRHLPDPERRHRVSKLPARPRHRLRNQPAKLLRRVRPPDGLAPIQHIHFRSAERRNRTEQHHRHAMAHQVQNHEPTA